MKKLHLFALSLLAIAATSTVDAMEINEERTSKKTPRTSTQRRSPENKIYADRYIELHWQIEDHKLRLQQLDMNGQQQTGILQLPPETMQRIWQDQIKEKEAHQQTMLQMMRNEQ